MFEKSSCISDDIQSHVQGIAFRMLEGLKMANKFQRLSCTNRLSSEALSCVCCCRKLVIFELFYEHN